MIALESGQGRRVLGFAAALALVCVSLIAQESAPETPPPSSAAATPELSDPAWRTLGLMRVRDMTPFGLNRLDMLPAHAVAATARTFAIEVTFNYQNTWAISDNVKDYLAARGSLRTPLSGEDVETLLAMPEEVYLVDGELGLVDLTLHYRFSSGFGLYATIPYYHFGSGLLDSTIESFHDGVGISNAGREFVPRRQFIVVADLQTSRLVLGEAPEDDLSDPVLGARYSLVDRPEWGNIILEAAYKYAWSDEEPLVSTGGDDIGFQVSFQRFFRRNALYLSLAAVHLGSPEVSQRDGSWIPTIVGGWETKVSRHLNFILQGYYSESVFQRTALEELSADKIQATVGLQWLSRGNVLRFGITENLASFNNTPDLGVTLSLGRVIYGE